MKSLYKMPSAKKLAAMERAAENPTLSHESALDKYLHKYVYWIVPGLAARYCDEDHIVVQRMDEQTVSLANFANLGNCFRPTVKIVPLESVVFVANTANYATCALLEDVYYSLIEATYHKLTGKRRRRTPSDTEMLKTIAAHNVLEVARDEL